MTRYTSIPSINQRHKFITIYSRSNFSSRGGKHFCGETRVEIRWKKEKGNKKGHSIIDSRRKFENSSVVSKMDPRLEQRKKIFAMKTTGHRYCSTGIKRVFISFPLRPPLCLVRKIHLRTCVTVVALKLLASLVIFWKYNREIVYCSVFPNLLKGSPREKQICSNGICSKCLVYLRSLIFFFPTPPPFLIVITTFISIFPSGKYFILMDHQIISKLFFLSQIYSTSSVMVER